MWCSHDYMHSLSCMETFHWKVFMRTCLLVHTSDATCVRLCVLAVAFSTVENVYMCRLVAWCVTQFVRVCAPLMEALVRCCSIAVYVRVRVCACIATYMYVGVSGY